MKPYSEDLDNGEKLILDACGEQCRMVDALAGQKKIDPAEETAALDHDIDELRNTVRRMRIRRYRYQRLLEGGRR